MGIYERPSEEFLDRLGHAFGFAPPRKPGHDVIGAIDAMLKGECKVFIAMGGNFAAAAPDTQATAQALRGCELTAHVATKLNRSHLVHGRQALILPCLGRTEIDLQASGVQGVTVEDSMSMVHVSTGMNPPASEHLLSEPAIVARLAVATLKQSRTPWLWLIEDYDRIRDKIAEVIDGFDSFNRDIRQSGGFHLANPAAQRRWTNPSGRALFFAHAIPDTSHSDTSQSETAPLLNLMTVRSHDQYNTTIYGFEDRYRGVSGHRRVCFINGADLRKLGFEAGQWVDMVSVWHDGERVAKRFLLVEYDIPEGCIASYYPETNILVPLDSFAERARTPASKSIPVRLRPSKSIPIQRMETMAKIESSLPIDEGQG
jgi:molybdopterin-dependent oxidoreductase alpha subunit